MRTQYKLIVSAGLLFAAAGSAQGQVDARPDLQLLDKGSMVRPIRIAPVAMDHGHIVFLDDWMDDQGSTTRDMLCQDNRIFDCYGDHNFDGGFDDYGGCGLGGQRWYFGTAFCGSNYTTNDMTLAPDTVIEAGATQANFAWYWTCGGSGSEQCILVVLTESSDANACEPDSNDLGGWAFDFGLLSCNPGGYYFTNLDISSVGVWALPDTGKGSYAVAFLTDNGLSPATCAQTLLWGASNNAGGDPDGPGEQGPMQLDDDNNNQTHEADECIDYTLGVCPDPLGTLIQFWGTRENPPLRGDFDHNGIVDTRDVLAFLTAWNNCDPASDCNVDGECNTQDVTCFLNGWTMCR